MNRRAFVRSLVAVPAALAGVTLAPRARKYANPSLREAMERLYWECRPGGLYGGARGGGKTARMFQHQHEMFKALTYGRIQS